MKSIKEVQRALKGWGRMNSTRIGTEYPCRSVGICGAENVSKYSIFQIDETTYNAVEKAVLKLRKFNERQYEILLGTYAKKMPLKTLLQEVQISSKQYYIEKANAEYFVFGSITGAFFA